MEVTVRRATEKDIPDMLCMYKELHEESPFSYLPLSETDSTEWLTTHLKSEHAIACVGVAEGKSVGFIMGLLYPFPHNKEFKVAVETGWWVLKSAPKTKLAGLLVRKFEQVAKQRGAAVVTIGRLANAGSEEKAVDRGDWKLSELLHTKKVG